MTASSHARAHGEIIRRELHNDRHCRRRWRYLWRQSIDFQRRWNKLPAVRPPHKLAPLLRLAPVGRMASVCSADCVNPISGAPHFSAPLETFPFCGVSRLKALSRTAVGGHGTSAGQFNSGHWNPAAAKLTRRCRQRWRGQRSVDENGAAAERQCRVRGPLLSQRLSYCSGKRTDLITVFEPD